MAEIKENSACAGRAEGARRKIASILGLNRFQFPPKSEMSG